MCGGNDSAATIKGSTTPEQDAAQREKDRQKILDDANYESPEKTAARLKDNAKPVAATDTVNAYLAHEKEFQGFDVAPPPDAPDVTDELVRKRRAAQASQLLLGRGRASTMLQSNFGDLQVANQRLLNGRNNK